MPELDGWLPLVPGMRMDSLHLGNRQAVLEIWLVVVWPRVALCFGASLYFDKDQMTSTFWVTEAYNARAIRTDYGVQCSAMGAGGWGGLCMGTNGSEVVKMSPLYQ